MTALVSGLAMIALLAGGGDAPAGSPQRDAAVSQLLALHQEVLEAHRTGDVSMLVGRDADEYVLVNRGEVTFPTLEQRRDQFTAYLRSTRFSKYEDVVEPVVQVSPDGRLGWVIAQVVARGVQDQGDGTSERIEFVCAWIELYENRDGRWYRIGNVSSFKPAEEAR